MTELPDSLRAAVPPASGPAVADWWAGLAEMDRLRVVDLWDARREAVFFERQADEAGRLDDWSGVPSVRGGRFLASDDAWGLAEWGPGYFEYLLANPELYPIHDPTHRTLHIGCTRHPAARACREAGGIPLDFACPVAAPACPLRALQGARLVARDGRSLGRQSPR